MSSPSQNPDPGGSTNLSSRELSDLKDQNEQQLVLIAQLKEMLRKSDQGSNVTEDKVQLYINTLNRKSKKEKTKTGAGEADTSISNIDANKKGKLNLLKQQMEENRAKLAERGKSQKGLEDMVTQLTVQFNDSQHLISQSPLNLSLNESKNLEYSKTSSPEELYNILLNKERKLTELGNKVQKLEGNLLDLQENLKEKDSVIDARTKAITLMTDSLSKKGKNTLDQLDDTKEQMRKMQENFVTLEQEMKARQLKLLDDLKLKNSEIIDLQEINQTLEKEKEELNGDLAHKIKLLEELRRENSPEEYLIGSPTRAGRRKKFKLRPRRSQSVQPEEDRDLEIVRTENVRLNSENEKLTSDNEKLTSQNEQLTSENTRLTSENERLTSVNENLVTETNQLSEEISRITEENKELGKNLKENIEKLESEMRSNITVEPSNQEEVAILKKQLEESNKNMIKVKAQTKSKIKDLTKKLDAFKKMSDSNALILQLQNENSTLSQKVAELEEEKGNLQLKMVESIDSLKDAPTSECNEEKDNLIKTLKKEIEELNEKLSHLKQAQNDQVTSEMSNIQFEEKLDQVDNEKQLLTQEKENLESENTELKEKLEFLGKEKAEINSKLENYIHENMELIDKLEKLSAEKVSSAESIEIVEGLTQQEKLELAAYQKNLEIPADLKWEGVDPMTESTSEAPEELNESVLQLSEDSTELLQKIEMFNVERKEVMLKLEALREEKSKLTEELKEFEALKEENSNISIKLKQIENNRDVLEETYEQLQTEKEVLERERNDLELKLRVMENQASENVTSSNKADLENKITQLQDKCEKLLEENEHLKKTVKQTNELIPEKESKLLEQSKESEAELNKFEEIINQYKEEIENYKTIIEENKEELINSSNLLNDIQTKLAEKETELANEKDEIEHLNGVIGDLNQVISDLEEIQNIDNKESDTMGVKIVSMETQLKDLKAALDEQISQAEEYEKELTQNSEIIDKLNKDIKETNGRLFETQDLLQKKDEEINSLTESMEEREQLIHTLENYVREKESEVKKQSVIIENLETSIKEKNTQFHQVQADLTEKFLTLQKQLEGNTGSVQDKITELQTKNKEQLEKMKKIAANLKKKNQECKDLNEKYGLEKEKWESELNEKTTEIVNLHLELEQRSSICENIQELESNNVKLQQLISKLEEECKTKQETINTINTRIFELEETITSLKTEKSTEREKVLNLKQEFTNVQEEVDDFKNGQEEKIKELQMIIETQEVDLTKYRDRINRLEEGISILEERKVTLERTNVALGDKLNETSASFEEKSYEEEQLEQRLTSLLQNDEILTKNLENINLENEELNIKNQDLLEDNDKLNEKLNALQNNLKGFELLQSKSDDLEQINTQLEKQMSILENQIKLLQNEKEEILRKSNSDFEKYEFETQNEITDLNNTKVEIQIKYEKLLEEFEEVKLKNEDINSNNNEKIEELENKLKTIENELKVTKEHEELLNQEIEKLRNELLRGAVGEVVEEIISEAKTEVNSRECSPEHKQVPFSESQAQNQEGQKSEQTSDWFADSYGKNAAGWFDLIAPTTNWFKNQEPSDQKTEDNAQHGNPQHMHSDNGTQFTWPQAPQENTTNSVQNTAVNLENMQENVQNPQANITENSREELLKKIKTLEFMLYNVEKEKDNALLQCNELSNELTRLVYERENKPKPIEEQLIKKTEDKSSLQVQASASQAQSSLESQILTDYDMVDDAQSRKELQNLEFEKSNASSTEESVLKKEAYKCFDENEDNSSPMNSFMDNNDDGWGLGPEDSKLEQEHYQNTENTNVLKTQVEDLTEEVNALKLEKTQHLEEIKQLQVKSGKLIKKCKEFKTKYEQAVGKCGASTSKKETDDFFNLDNTIQEELKSQVERLEKKLKDINNEYEKEKSEKQALTKKVDTLSVANEKLIELKEKQEVEITNAERKYQEIVRKMDDIDWENGNFSGQSKKEENLDVSEDYSKKYQECKKQVEELTETVKDIMADNEDLQSILEEQKNLRNEAESKLKNILTIQENSKSEEEYNKILQENNQLETQLHKITFTLKALQESKQIEEHRTTDLCTEEKLNKLESEIKAAINERNEFENRMLEMEQNNALVLNERNELEEKMIFLEGRLIELKDKMKNLDENSKLLQNEYDNLQEKTQEKGYSDDVKLLEEKLSDLQNQNAELWRKNLYYEEKIKDLNYEITEYRETIKSMSKNAEELVGISDYQALNQKLTEFEQKKIEIDELHKKIKEYEENYEEISELKKHIEILEEEKLKLNQTLLETQELMANKSSSADVESCLNAQIFDFHLQISSLEQEKSDLKTKIGDLEQKVHNQTSESKNQNISSFDLDLLNAQISELKVKIQLLEEEKDNLNQVLLDSQSQISQLNNKIDSLEQEKESLNQTILQIQGETIPSTDIEVLNSEITELKQKNNVLEQEKEALNQTLLQNQQNLENYYEQYQETVNELNAKWQEEVDKRGSDVAESWKMHLEGVETEFGSVKNRMQNDLDELEEKCNALVNENNELRKNVDAEIRNEIDKISALQQQISNGQKTISDLNNSLVLRQNECEAMQNNIAMLEVQIDQLKNELTEKDARLSNVNIIIETTQKQFDEKHEVVNEIVKILEKNPHWSLSFEKQDIVDEFKKQISGCKEKDEEIYGMNQKMQQYETNLTALNQQLESKSIDLEKSEALVEDYKVKLEEFKATHIVLQNSIEEKNREIHQLTQRLELTEQKQNDSNKDVQTMETELNQYKNDYVTLQSSLADIQTQLYNTTQLYNEKCSECIELNNLRQQNDNYIDVNRLESELTQIKNDYQVLQQSLSDVTQNYYEKCNEIEMVNIELSNVQQNLEFKQSEFNNLRLIYDQKCQEITQNWEESSKISDQVIQTEELYKNKLRELENYYENAMLERHSEFETIFSQKSSLENQLEVLQTEYSHKISKLEEEYQNMLQEKTHTIENLQHSGVQNVNLDQVNQHHKLQNNIAELEHQLLEYNKLVTEQNNEIEEQRQQKEKMMATVQKQEAKIEELKHELFEKSKEFDSIIAEMDIGRDNEAAVTKQPTFTTDQSPTISKPLETEESDTVNRAELDLALYMLHQRDVKCEELIMELTQLLEERDTLQLRLSNAIREKEELRRKTGQKPVTEPEASTSSTSSPARSSAIFMAASGIELAKEMAEHDGEQNLATKLSELKQVGYKKDKTLLDEQEKRRMQQLSIMQEHIHEASKLPPEAAQRLVDASYTLSRDVQSPSKVLLNWLWGRSTPKVNES